MRSYTIFLVTTILLVCMAIPSAAKAQFTIEFDQSDFFGFNGVFSEAEDFSFSLNASGTLVAGTTYSNPALNGVVYFIFGPLDPNTPSGFPSFDLQRDIGGLEYYSQGSSLNFEVAANADLTDGVQASELVDDGSGLIFEINARELNTGRFHPPLFQLFADGTGRIQNSNNTGGINPATQTEVNGDFGDEYITEFQFDADSFTLATTAVLKGDVDMDGDVDFLDVGPFIAVLQAGSFQAEADTDCNGPTFYRATPLPSPGLKSRYLKLYFGDLLALRK